MSVQRISTLAREHWYKGAHAGKHLRVHPEVYEWMVLLAPDRDRDTTPYGLSELGQSLGFSGISVVVEPELPPGMWLLAADAEPHEVAEWGCVGNPECEHREPADATTLADAGSRIHWFCGCGAHWFDLSPHAQLRYEPVREPWSARRGQLD